MARAESRGRTGARGRGRARRRWPPNTSSRHGLAIVTRNFRTRHGEIDLIARDGDTLVFVEVRLRRSANFGGAAASITAAKRARLVAAARDYLAGLGARAPVPLRRRAAGRLDPSRIAWERDILSG